MLDGEQVSSCARWPQSPHPPTIITRPRRVVAIRRRREVSSYAVGGRWYQHSAASLAICSQYSHC